MKARAVTCVVLAAALSPASLTGCSFLATRPPPKTPLVSTAHCSGSHFPPVADVILAVNAGALALLAWGAAMDEYTQDQMTVVPSWNQKPISVDSSLFVLGGIATAATIAFTASAAHGFESVHDCRVAQREFMRTHPPIWPPGAYPYAYPPGTTYPYPPGAAYPYPPGTAYPYAHPPGAWPPPPSGAPSTESALEPSTEAQSAPPPHPPTPVVTRSASVVAPSAELRSAPFIVAPVVVVLAHGQHLFVDPTPNAGWRFATLSDGRAGYVQDAQIKVDSP
jgi:hypothetical protein